MATDDITGRDPEAPTLRERNRAATRQAIIEAYAELSLEQGFNNFTMQEIADRVGISHRTLYRYFDDRDAIVEGLYAEITEQAHAPGSDRFMDGSGLLRHNYRVFGRFRTPMLVGTLMIEAGMLEAPGRAARTEYLREKVEEAAPGLNELGRRQVLGLLRVVAGAMAWARMTGDEIGLDDDDAGAASAWAIDALLEAASREEGDLS